MKIRVYAKLSVNREEIRRVLPKAEVAPPVVRNDVHRDIDRGFNVIAIVDGRFDQSLSVSPCEIMDALRCGVRVYGSSSMGALRAVETATYGMIGVGRIFEFIASSTRFRDDLLGQAFMGATQGFKSLTYVDFHFAGQRLLEQRQLSPVSFKKLCAVYERLHYSERNEQKLRHLLRGRKTSSILLRDAERILNSRHSQKREDALLMLARIRRDLTEIKAVNEHLLSGQKKTRNPLKFYPPGLLEGLSLSI